MKIEKYALKAESSLTLFEFISEGPKGLIRKIIQFQETNEPNLYNLAFGDKDEQTGEIDDLAVSSNGDSEKVLTTVGLLYMLFLTNTQAHLYTPPEVQVRRLGFIEWV